VRRRIINNLYSGNMFSHLFVVQIGKVYIILIMKVMPFLPPPALFVDTSQQKGGTAKGKKVRSKDEELLKTQI
jgi:hypothetical protein